MGYEDNPTQLLTYLKALTGEELKLYIKGYIQACSHTREALTQGKVELLSALLEDSDNPHLELCISLLDKYETIVRIKEDNLLRFISRLESENLRV